VVETSFISYQFGVAALLIAATFFVHAIFIAIGAFVLRALRPTGHGVRDLIGDVFWLVMLAVWLLIAHFTSIAMWAVFFYQANVFLDMETALYFAGSTYTTLGYGDVLPAEEWRLLSGALATNGLLLFGLSAAVLVDATVRLRLGGDIT
jgi:hypothetical protein